MRSLRSWVGLSGSVLAMASAMGLLGGCASKPTMRINHAEITGLRVALPPSITILMTLYVDVFNPNSYDVAIRAVRGQVLLANRYTVPVDFRAEGDGLWLRSDGTTAVAVPLSIPAPIGAAILGESLWAQAIPYQFVGRADVTASHTFKIESDDYSVNESGWVSRQQLEAALRGGL